MIIHLHMQGPRVLEVVMPEWSGLEQELQSVFQRAIRSFCPAQEIEDAPEQCQATSSVSHLLLS